VSAVIGVLFLVGSLIIRLTEVTSAVAEALVLPGAALLWFGLAIYLLMLGLIGEAALRGTREQWVLPALNEEEG